MQLKYRDDITWQDMPRIERPFFAKSKLSADLSRPHPRISRFAFKNPLSEAYKRFSRDIDPSGLKNLYRKIEQGSVLLVLTTEYDVFSPAFIWKEDPNHKDKGQWQLSQEISSEAEFSYKLLLTEVKKPGPRGGVSTASSEPLFPGANMADTRRAVANTAIDTVNTVTDGYRKRELAEHSGRYPQLNSGVSENPMEIDKLKYDDEAYGEFAGTMAGAIGMIGTRKPPKDILRNKNFDNASFNKIYKQSAETKVEIDTISDDIANMFDGKVAKAPIKSKERAIEKINNEYDGDSTLIKDLARNTIIVSPDKIENVAAELQKRGAKVIDGGTDPLGYSGYNTTVKTSSGGYGEIQVNTPVMIYAKEPESVARNLLGDDTYSTIASKSNIQGGKGHTYYEEWRSLKPNSKEAESIAEKSREYYEAIRKANGY